MNGCPLPSRYRLAPPASTVAALNILQGIDLYYFLPGISDGTWTGAGFAPPDPDPQSCPCKNMPCTLPLSDSTRDTPVVMSTLRRPPRITSFNWISTTPPTMELRSTRLPNTS